MKNTKTYMWFSPATDITGNKLAEALDITCGRDKPESNKKVVIGWGAKTSKDVTFNAKTLVFNHPNAIRKNRNKFESSKVMANALNTGGQRHIAKLVVAGDVKRALDAGEISLPLIGRRNYHQGGKGFWTCPTSAQLNGALDLPEKECAQYFQEMLPIKDEYRLHVFGNKVIHAVKKVKRSAAEFEAAFIEDELCRQRSLAEKNNNPFDEDTAKQMLRRQAKNAVAGGPNMLLRSNRLGWKFSIVKKFSKDMEAVAIKAVKALGLTFGAVDTCITEDGTPYIFEVNTGPGLEATSFDKYVAAFKSALSMKTTPKEAAAAIATGAKTPIEVKKEMLTTQLERLQTMVKEANDDELATIERVGTALIFGKTD